ncbi:hypothetical protein PM082_022606 [Marasmius tenuissimus]|nr:hypothetical protein PM082_022606 [Marasmius tenuissimus]
MSYHTAITITTTPSNPPCSSDALTPLSPRGRRPRVQLVEERRTYYVTSDIPASQWEHEDIANALKLPELSAADGNSESPFQRSKSQNEMQASPQSLPTSPPPRPRSIQEMPSLQETPSSPPSRYQSRRPHATKPVVNPGQTPPNTPTVKSTRPKVLFIINTIPTMASQISPRIRSSTTERDSLQASTFSNHSSSSTSRHLSNI